MGLENAALVAMLIATACVVFSRRLYLSLIAMSLFSMFLTLKYLLLHAPDVAITEAALGAGLSTLVFLVAIKKTGRSRPKL